MNIIIAHFIKVRVWRQVFAISVLVIIFLCILYAVGKMHGGLYNTLETRPFLFLLVAVGYMLSFLAILTILVMINRLLFQDGVAVWIRDDALIYLHKTNVYAPKRNILNIIPGEYGRSKWPCINIEMRNTTDKIIPTTTLIEKQDEIITALKKWLLEG